MKKAKLDILEDIPELDIELPGPPLSSDEGNETIEVSGNRWALNKLLIIGAPFFLGVLIVVGLLIFYFSSNVSKGPQQIFMDKKQQSDAIQPVKTEELSQSPVEKKRHPIEKSTLLHLKDFMIDLKDANGRHCLLMFDILLDLGAEPKQMPELENITDMRNIIFTAAQNRSAVALRSVEERKKLKKISPLRSKRNWAKEVLRMFILQIISLCDYQPPDFRLTIQTTRR